MQVATNTMAFLVPHFENLLFQPNLRVEPFGCFDALCIVSADDTVNQSLDHYILHLVHFERSVRLGVVDDCDQESFHYSVPQPTENTGEENYGERQQVELQRK